MSHAANRSSPKTSGQAEPTDTANSNGVTPKFVASVRQQMLAFARSQLGDYHMAEDVVQETFIAALQYGDKFRGEAAFKSWVFAILKNKIVDNIRKNSKYTPLSSFVSSEEGNQETLIEALFNEAGSWYPDCKPRQFDDSWSNPEIQVQSEGFWHVLEACLTKLPSEQARAFLMREYIELATEEICETLDISASNYYVLMHRARLGLQTCLSIRWFESP